MPPSGCATATLQDLTAAPAVAAYCRRARRLRGQLARHPAKLHRKLRELGSPTRGAAGLEMPTVVPSRAARFAEAVAAEFDCGVLRFTQRRGLLRRAAREGIGGFEANLIIAAVQHQRRKTASSRARPTAAGPARSLAPLLVVVAVEALVALGAWQIWVG